MPILGPIWIPILVDKFTKEQRSRIMAKISGKETKPEIMVRKFLFNSRLRYRKNVNTLPGTPDIVLPKYKTVVFVHGCFWHGHEECNRSKLPSTKYEFWREKISNNVSRDDANIKGLRSLGWHTAIIWQCEINTINKRVIRFEKLLNEILKN